MTSSSFQRLFTALNSCVFGDAKLIRARNNWAREYKERSRTMMQHTDLRCFVIDGVVVCAEDAAAAAAAHKAATRRE